MQNVQELRRQWVDRFYPEGMPRLWCPAVTHYDADGNIDKCRMERHLAHMSRWVKTFLLLGSTGDGWELTRDEKQALVVIAVGLAKKHGFKMLIGILEPKTADVRTGILDTLELLRRLSGKQDPLQAMEESHISGFTVCPPKGADLSQTDILDSMKSLLDLGLPMALYQLPQITLNEMSPDTVEILASSYPNFYLFKDTSGQDRIVQSGRDFGGVFFVRGAEGDYDRWYRENNGYYDGFLLSSANSFAEKLWKVLDLIQNGEVESAKVLSARLSRVIANVFGEVSGLPYGNAFANANKCIDHINAYGNLWADQPLPILHARVAIPRECISRTEQFLREENLYPESRYLAL